ncbi:Ferrichrome-iron receptor precursor [Marinomonas spartinae]|uniref:Ferrichrome-iron receptor n=1 Tax=Marinomonas spartinae TaxID=1792290 RepID=A0A1A8TRE9_9GAMM|nr:TonB-dependent receptor [Marinomonas spartinae]SBS36668.1 Ferrichrome-iron receptor precursor [Marinomonas spartinae]
MKLNPFVIAMQACSVLAISTNTLADTTTNIKLNTMDVKGRALSYYKDDETSFATRTQTPIDKTPQSVQVVTHTMIEDQAARQITDLYRSISGLSQNNVSTVTLRGFSQDEILYDGLKGDPYGDFSIPQLFTIDQVQVLKGPSGALYGAGEPGGVINYVTKKPTYDPHNTVQASVGNKHFLSGSVESSGPLNKEASKRYRVGIYSDGQHSYRNNVKEQNRIIDLGYAWDINDNDTLTTQYTNIHQNINGARLRGIPTDNDGNFLAPLSWNNNEKTDYQELNAQVFQTKLDHTINSWLDSNVAVRYFENTETQKYHEINKLLDTNGDGIADTSKRQYRDQVRKRKGITLAGNLIAELGKHTLLVGSEFYHEKNRFTYSRATGTADGVSNLSLIHPVYGKDNTNNYIMHKHTNEDTTSDQLGLYVQDQWAITNKLELTSGVRVDRIKQDYHNHLKDSSVGYYDTGYSTRIGATYEINDHLKPYTAFSTGFVPQDAENQQTSVGGPFDPEESRQIEVGMRSYWLNNRLNVNLATYHIIRRNILQEDPNDTDKKVAFGQVRSQGVELDIMADITSRWVANINYAYNDTIVEKAFNGIKYANGKRFANTPHNQLGVWTRYDFPHIRSSIGLGADYVSQQINRQGQKVKPYTVYDASWQTHWEKWKFQLNIKNLFDKKYAVSGFTKTIGSFVGERRRVYLSATYDF